MMVMKLLQSEFLCIFLLSLASRGSCSEELQQQRRSQLRERRRKLPLRDGSFGAFVSKPSPSVPPKPYYKKKLMARYNHNYSIFRNSPTAEDTPTGAPIAPAPTVPAPPVPEPPAPTPSPTESTDIPSPAPEPNTSSPTSGPVTGPTAVTPITASPTPGPTVTPITLSLTPGPTVTPATASPTPAPTEETPITASPTAGPTVTPATTTGPQQVGFSDFFLEYNYGEVTENASEEQVEQVRQATEEFYLALFQNRTAEDVDVTGVSVENLNTNFEQFTSRADEGFAAEGIMMDLEIEFRPTVTFAEGSSMTVQEIQELMEGQDGVSYENYILNHVRPVGEPFARTTHVAYRASTTEPAGASSVVEEEVIAAPFSFIDDEFEEYYYYYYDDYDTDSP